MCPLYEGASIKYKLNSQFLTNILRDAKQDKDEEPCYTTINIPTMNQLPYSNTRFFERTFTLLKIEEVIAIYTAILSEEKTILIVAKHKYDLLAIFQTLMDLIYPFEWCMPMIPFINSTSKNPNAQAIQMINHMQSIIIGINVESFDAMKEQIAEETDNLSRLIVIDVSHDRDQLGNRLESKSSS